MPITSVSTSASGITVRLVTYRETPRPTRPRTWDLATIVRGARRRALIRDLVVEVVAVGVPHGFERHGPPPVIFRAAIAPSRTGLHSTPPPRIATTRPCESK